MKLSYYPDTDSLYIDLTETPSVESREISEEVVLDYDEAGNVVGIDIDNANQKIALNKLTLRGCLKICQTSQATHHEMDHRDTDHGCTRLGYILIILR
jgi:uncharacterized protein YuzE